jgi:uncharacterized protein YbjT (DUF2867 family)
MKAIVIGATGLVGNLILSEILKDDVFKEVTIFVRRSTGINNPKLKEIINPLEEIKALSSDIKGDILFNAMGTTIKKAGSYKEQQRVDRDIPIEFAKIASENGVKTMLNVSSTGANINSGFYLKTKAEMENGTAEFFPENCYHFRPGLLVGNRKEFRFFEKISSAVMKVIDPLLTGSAKKYRSMPVEKLAKAMVNVGKKPAGKPFVLHYTEIMQCI